jgi:hypothetical protein
VPALLTRWISGLLRLHLLQHGRQPLVVDDRAGMGCAGGCTSPFASK